MSFATFPSQFQHSFFLGTALMLNWPHRHANQKLINIYKSFQNLLKGDFVIDLHHIFFVIKRQALVGKK